MIPRQCHSSRGIIRVSLRSALIAAQTRRSPQISDSTSSSVPSRFPWSETKYDNIATRHRGVLRGFKGALVLLFRRSHSRFYAGTTTEEGRERRNNDGIFREASVMAVSNFPAVCFPFVFSPLFLPFPQAGLVARKRKRRKFGRRREKTVSPEKPTKRRVVVMNSDEQ